MGHNIDFESIPWQRPMQGLRYKAFRQDNRQIRLAEFSEGFTEEDWCRRGHSGYVLGGVCDVDYGGHVEHLAQGDIFHIPAGENDRHKVLVPRGSVTLLLFEDV